MPETEVSSTPRRAGRRLWLWMFLLVLWAVLGAAYWALGPTHQAAQISIPRGAGAKAIGEILENSGLVRSGEAFAWLAQATGQDADLRSGTFELRGRGARELLADISYRARPVTLRVVFPEGWRTIDIAQRLTARNLPGEELLRLAQKPDSVQLPLKPPVASLEGYLFPDTYLIAPEASAEEIAQAMVQKTATMLTPEGRAEAEALGLTVHQWLTLASIVQAESGNLSEMPWVAGVFLNRLEVGMPLQSDPTVAYALGKRMNALDRRLGDFSVDSPYNTYKTSGLPPTPINNPGQEALQAVLNSERTNPEGEPYLYFFHAGGKIYLNTDFASHLQDLISYSYSSE